MFSVVLVVLVSSRWVGRWVIGVEWWSEEANDVVLMVKLSGKCGVCGVWYYLNDVGGSSC